MGARAQTAPQAPELTASVLPGELTYGAALTVTGRLLAGGQAVAGAPLELQADAFPFGRFVTVARLTTMLDGGFVFSGLKLDRDTRLRVVEQRSPEMRSAVLPVIVDPSAAIDAVSLGRGRTRLSLRVGHTPEGGSASVTAWWFAAAHGSHVFRLVAVTPTRELSAGITHASATIDPPAKRFTYRVCFNPTWERAMGAPTSHRPCPEHDYVVAKSAG